MKGGIMKARRLTWLLVAAICALVLVGSALAMSSTNYRLDWFTLLNSSSGGASDSTNYAINFTVGQTAIYASSSANYEARLGYWFGSVGTGGARYKIYIPLVLRNFSS